MSLARRAAILLGASGILIVLLALNQLRPALPRQGFPADARQLKAWLALALWAVLALIVVGLLVRVLRAGPRIAGGSIKSRAGRAFGEPSQHGTAGTTGTGDWRTYARALELPSIRLGRAAVADVGEIAASSGSVEPRRVETSAATEGQPPLRESGSGMVGLHVLGPFELTGSERSRPRLAATTELLVYLTLHPKGATRDELLNALWPDEEIGARDQRFWQVTSEARKLVRGALLRKRDRYKLDRRQLRIDLDQLQPLLEAAEQAEGEEASQEPLERALSLFQGPPLQGIDYLWADGTVRHLTATYLDIIGRAAQVRLAVGDARGAIELAERGLEVDQLQEHLWQVALEAEATLGQRESVTRRYDRLVSVLDTSVGLEPTRETRSLYLRLLGQS